ncbi:succinylglutamate desuccinylase/aspartoacylase family protein [Rossellomorea marisflavi]|uniref:succinylglutamate desuccinylase/aspartoacylase domain-containing protein n=1 Tax=Rossellomorea marisflavi TaxID=189381 RepID=UPI0035110C89
MSRAPLAPFFSAAQYIYKSLGEALGAQPVGTVSRIVESSEGQSIILFLVKGNVPGPTIWTQAAVHGDEHDGIKACADLLGGISPVELRGNLIICPVANPTAMLEGTNGSPLDGLNLNRVFGRGIEGNSYSIRHGEWLAGKIITHADFLIDLHGGGRWLDVCSFAMVAGDDEEAFNRSMAALSEVPLNAAFITRAEEKGMLINKVCKKGIPAVLLENGGGNQWSDAAVQSHVRSVKGILHKLGLYPRHEAAAASHEHLLITEIAELRFQKSGLLTFSRQAGEVVRQGEELIRVLSYPELEEYSLICPIEHGVILSIHAATTVFSDGYAAMLGKLS